MKPKTLVAILGAAAIAMTLPTTAFAEKLVLAIGARAYGQVVPNSIKVFEKANPNIKVKWLKVSNVPNETRQLFVTDLMSRSPTPDVYALDIIWVGGFARRGWLVPLDKYLSKSKLGSFNQSFLKAATLNGNIYAAPLLVNGTHLFYRKDLLEKYGLKPPKTWAELIKDSQIIMHGQHNPELYGFVSMWAKIEGLFMNWLSFTNGNGGGFTNAAGKIDVNSPANIKATQTMVDLLYKYHLAPRSILNDRPVDATTLFKQGRAIFLMVQGFAYNSLSATDSAMKTKFDFERIPHFTGHPNAHTTALGGFLLGINPNSKHKKAAAKLIASFTSRESQVWGALQGNTAPAVPALYKLPAIRHDKVLQKLGSDFNYGIVRPSMVTGNLYPQISEIMQVQISKALHKQVSVKQALDTAQKEIENLLKQNQ